MIQAGYLLAGSPSLRWADGRRDRALADVRAGRPPQSDDPDYAEWYRAARLVHLAELRQAFIVTNRAKEGGRHVGVFALYGPDCGDEMPEFFDLQYLRNRVAEGVQLFDHLGNDYLCAALPIQ